MGSEKNTFELSVVWDSQFVMSFTLYMLDHPDYNLHVHVFGNDLIQFKYSLSCSFLTLMLRRLWQKLRTVDDYLHQRMPLNSVQSLTLQRRRFVHFGYNRMHLTGWLIISVITCRSIKCKQLNIDVVTLYWCVLWIHIKTVTELIAVN